MANPNTVTTRDNGALILLEVTHHFKKGIQGIRVGIVGSKAEDIHSNSDITNAELMFIHEYGLGVPERPVIRPATELATKNIMKAYEKGNKKMMQMIKRGNKDVQSIVKAGLEEAREYLESEFKDYIREGKVGPPTQEGNTPLIQSGELVEAISAYIETKSGGTPSRT